MATEDKKFAHAKCGPGGLYCPCCGPPPRQRKKFFRAVKRAFRAITKRRIREELNR